MAKNSIKNLDDKAAYISLENPAAAVFFVEALQISVKQLASFRP
ncbi:hypothetical protein PSYMP_26241 [Pseudomonas amygdali pv. morsprunorum str. M302280]|nr:hypothetical protein PSYMP_26241 [Pseudomonas amygdali pv. morsprunorum str. M302280]